MVKAPWRRKSSDREPDDTDERDSGDNPAGTGDSSAPEESGPSAGEEPVVSCEFQDGTLSVYEELLHIERHSGSKFDDKWIAMNQVRGVTYTENIVIHYMQIEQVDFENSTGGMFSSPVDENTLHFGHGKRACAKRARDAILERTTPK